MSKKTGSTDKVDNEIDLLDLMYRLGKSIRRGSKAIGKGFLIVFFFLVKKWFWLTMSLLVGVALSFSLKLSTERLYSSDIIFRSNAIPNDEMISYINKLHTFCEGKNFDELASALSVPRSGIINIKDIEAFWIIDRGSDLIPDYVDFKNRHNVLDTVNVRMRDRFLIRVKTTIPQELSVIRDGIVKYIEKNQFYQAQNELRLSQAEVLLKRIDYEVEQLDSLQKVKYFEETRKLIPGEGGQMIFLQDYETQLLHEDIYELIEKRQEFERIKTIHAGLITLLSDFTPPSKAENGVLYYGRIMIPCFFILAVIILLFIDNRKKLQEVYKKY